MHQEEFKLFADIHVKSFRCSSGKDLHWLCRFKHTGQWNLL